MTDFTPESMRRITDQFKKNLQPGNVRGLLVAGSGLHLEVPGWEKSETVALGDVLPFPMYELMGHEHSLSLWRRGDETLLVMNGRLHLYQGYAPEEVVAPVRLAALLGAEMMIATNAAGALDSEMAPGSLVIISDHLNMQGSNPLAGAWGREFGPQFPDMSDAYDKTLRKLALEAAEASGFECSEGVYAGMLGPSFETPAEIRMLAAMGCKVVGMSTVCEVIAARHMGMRVLAMSLATNPAAGLVDRPLTHEEVLEAGRDAAVRMKNLLGALVLEIF